MILIRSASLRRFVWVPQHMISWRRKRKQNINLYLLVWKVFCLELWSTLHPVTFCEKSKLGQHTKIIPFRYQRLPFISADLGLKWTRSKSDTPKSGTKPAIICHWLILRISDTNSDTEPLIFDTICTLTIGTTKLPYLLWNMYRTVSLPLDALVIWWICIWFALVFFPVIFYFLVLR